MSKDEDSVFPQHEIVQPEQPMGEHFLQIVGGLSKRELFAALAMTGLITKLNMQSDEPDWAETVVEDATQLADALIAELERPR